MIETTRSLHADQPRMAVVKVQRPKTHAAKTQPKLAVRPAKPVPLTKMKLKLGGKAFLTVERPSEEEPWKVIERRVLRD